ncbi:Arginine biosynthesis bifunctional protein ArgJ [Anatilimnocola aggregata]|uniref:Arginine biosynthesis bifunctional protein ArgJ n=1 Tax=Anatilimnocola aggregata TaxID=2528021 RepID=A0A517Y6B0_9BACT|nr:bifunctional glutamate N-acetyltransferase/amino-acid acetyltransferase ArgJ [Anatilimnocola aggregata]QDU25774.1 Arginine biosynthesis bifunctional protein ArgJ [Anatilimnocola aggregata]
MSIEVPAGFVMNGVHGGIKKVATKEDFTLIHCPKGATAAGVYTQNLVFAAPVGFDRSRTPSANIRVVAVNSGNANACTGERGMNDCREMARLAATAVGENEQTALVMSTGVIGVFLPMDKIANGAKLAAEKLGNDEASFLAAARGIMTTDQFHKVVARQVNVAGRTIRLAGMCKGAGMIGPHMATMLAIMLTDAPLTPAAAQQVLKAATDESFNCISVEGHMSTNDTLLLLASGAAGGEPLTGSDLAAFQAALTDACIELAQQIPDDGEGASHLIGIEITGCQTRDAAQQIAKTVANSALVKTAVAGADPNWGRIVSAAGYAGVPFNPDGVGLIVNGHELYRAGAPVPFDAKTVSAAIKSERKTHIKLTFTEGSAVGRFWTSDLNVNYVRFNADYTT